MKRFVMWCICWALYLTGDILSRVMMFYDALSFLYPAENWLMGRSGDISDAHGFTVWQKVNKEE